MTPNLNLYCGDCAEVLKTISDNSIDMTITSPPYDDLRDYNGYTFDFESIAKQLYRVTKDGGVVVWIVNDATVNGSETGTSFRQALYFKDIGFNLHDTMIWEKFSFTATGSLQCRYAPVFEYMFVLSKGKPKTFNPIMDKVNTHCGEKFYGTIRNKDGSMRQQPCAGNEVREFGQRHNVWRIDAEHSNAKRFHPAVFPLQLAIDHIKSWSNEGDMILDPMMGSGTSGIASIQLGRNFTGIEISEEYFNIAKARIEETVDKTSLMRELI